MKRIALIVFIVVALVQLAVPLDMIRNKEKVIAKGKAFHFKTAPIDPEDPFRGRFIYLSMDADRYKLTPAEAKIEGETAYARIKTNKEGYGEVAAVTAEAPAGTSDYVKVEITKLYAFDHDEEQQRWVTLPFDRYYMEESKAPEAERVYRHAARDTSQVAYAVVHVLDGEGVVTDVIIDGKSIKEIVKENGGQ